MWTRKVQAPVAAIIEINTQPLRDTWGALVFLVVRFQLVFICQLFSRYFIRVDTSFGLVRKKLMKNGNNIFVQDTHVRSVISEKVNCYRYTIRAFPR